MASNLGLLAARAIIGAGIFSHGAQKGLGWFGGPGPAGAGQFMASLGFKPGESYARAAYTNEMVAGALILTGALGPVGPALLISTMVVAARSVHWPNGFFAQNGGYELSAVYSAGAAALGSSGYGSIAIDHLLGIDNVFAKPGRPMWVLVLGVAGAIAVLSQREVAESSAPAPAPEPASDASSASAHPNGQPLGTSGDIGSNV